MRPRTAPSLEIAPCDLGYGLFALRSFRPGDLILRLSGPRFWRDDPIHSTQVGANLMQTGRRSYILLQPPGVFANHSCDPNAGIMANRRMVAIRPIVPGDEIRFDYSTTMDEDYWTMACHCGATTCRGVVTDFRLLPLEIKQRYLTLGVVQRFIARAERRRAGSAPDPVAAGFAVGQEAARR